MRCLNLAGILNMLICGQDVLLYGEPRLTKYTGITLGVGTATQPDMTYTPRLGE